MSPPNPRPAVFGQRRRGCQRCRPGPALAARCPGCGRGHRPAFAAAAPPAPRASLGPELTPYSLSAQLGEVRPSRPSSKSPCSDRAARGGQVEHLRENLRIGESALSVSSMTSTRLLRSVGVLRDAPVGRLVVRLDRRGDPPTHRPTRPSVVFPELGLRPAKWIIAVSSTTAPAPLLDVIDERCPPTRS